MSIRKKSALVLVVVFMVAAGRGHAADRAEKPPPIATTQLTLQLVPVQARATVIAIASETLTILTAAHFLSPEDVGRTIQIVKGVSLRGKVVAVARNPAFRQLRSRQSNEPSPFGTMGVDSAVATIKVDLRGARAQQAFAAIRAVELVRDPILSNSGQMLYVHIVDQFDREHVIRASNHQNPRCLVWGRQSYDTQRGDSGAGVFFMRKNSDGEEWPILIGNVSQTDARGALASLAYGSERWVRKALEAAREESR
jgi:hypothetical protein